MKGLQSAQEDKALSPEQAMWLGAVIGACFAFLAVAIFYYAKKYYYKLPVWPELNATEMDEIGQYDDADEQ